MIPRPPSSSPSVQPVLRKSLANTSKSVHKRSSLSSMSQHSCSTADLSLDSSLHSCSCDDKFVTFQERVQVRHIESAADFTQDEIDACYYGAEDMLDMKDQASAEAKKLVKLGASAKLQRGYENFSNTRKFSMVMMARDAVIYDQCLENYGMNAKVSLREAQERAALDAAEVDRNELEHLMMTLPRPAPAQVAKPTMQARLTSLLQRRNRRNKGF